jgi:hypothetical protein
MDKLPLDDWDPDYLDQIAAAEETAWVEKKSYLKWNLSAPTTKRETLAEIAKQVCAFANSGDGFLVFGIGDTTKQLDQGIEPLVGQQTVKSWVEAVIPNLLTPQVTACQARFIEKPGFHQAGRGVLVIQIPLSESRPHWHTTNERQVAYIRTGEHSAPMLLQTFLDIASRNSAFQAEILGLGIQLEPTKVQFGFHFRFNPVVRLVGGTVCEHWAVDVHLPNGQGKFLIDWNTKANYSMPQPDLLCIEGRSPLIRNRPTRASEVGILVEVLNMTTPLTISLYAGPQPVKHEFTLLSPGSQ